MMREGVEGDDGRGPLGWDGGVFGPCFEVGK